jgi:hypothetical protein
MESYFDNFAKQIRPFNSLWNSATVTSIAVGHPGERRSVTTRIALRGEELPKGQPYRQVTWLLPTPEFMIAVVDFPKAAAVEILRTAVDRYHVNLETDSTVDRVLLKWPLPGDSVDQTQPTRLSSFSWQAPFRYERPWARNQLGENRTCLALTGTGDNIGTLVPDQLRRDVDSKLRRDPPHFDGIQGLYETLLPGLSSVGSDCTIVQVVFPLPLDMEQTEDGKLALRTPNVAVEGQTRIVLNFKPVNRATAIEVMRSGAEPTANENAIQWRWEIPWQQGDESGKASLFYAGEEVSNVSLRRWPAAGTLRAAIDCYFDPNHELLQEALFGKNERGSRDGKAQDAFEMAVIRLMHLLGIHLVWYGKAALPRRSDAAGLVDEREKRVVVLAECTVEKPEAKFSALKERAQELTKSLAGEAEVLPLVFTQADPPGSVSETAAEHGIAMVGRNELRSLFEMLSATTRTEDVLTFLDRLRSRVNGLFSRLGGM